MSHTARSLNSQLEYIQTQLDDLRNSVITDPVLSDADRELLLAMRDRSQTAVNHLKRQLYVHAQIAQVTKSLANLDITEKSDKDEKPEKKPAEQQQDISPGLTCLLRALEVLNPNHKIEAPQQDSVKQAMSIKALLPNLLNDNFGILVGGINVHHYTALISQVLIYHNSGDPVRVALDNDKLLSVFRGLSINNQLGTFEEFKRSAESAIEDRVKERAKELGINFRELPESYIFSFS